MSVNRFVGRKYLLDRIQKHFDDKVMVVVFIGMGGVSFYNTFRTDMQLIGFAGSRKNAISAGVLENATSRELNFLNKCYIHS